MIVRVPSEDAPVAMEVEDERTQDPQATCVRMGNRFEKINPRAVALVFPLGEAQRGVRFRMNQSQPVGTEAVDSNPK